VEGVNSDEGIGTIQNENAYIVALFFPPRLVTTISVKKNVDKYAT
jgi:hypothetical protein